MKTPARKLQYDEEIMDLSIKFDRRYFKPINKKAVHEKSRLSKCVVESPINDFQKMINDFKGFQM